MPKTRQTHTKELKLKVVLESLQRDTTIESVRRKFNLHSTQITTWRKTFSSRLGDIATLVFETKSKANKQKPIESNDDLVKLIGELTIQNQILKKALESLD